MRFLETHSTQLLLFGMIVKKFELLQTLLYQTGTKVETKNAVTRHNNASGERHLSLNEYIMVADGKRFSIENMDQLLAKLYTVGSYMLKCFSNHITLCFFLMEQLFESSVN